MGAREVSEMFELDTMKSPGKISDEDGILAKVSSGRWGLQVPQYSKSQDTDL